MSTIFLLSPVDRHVVMAKLHDTIYELTVK